MNSFFIENAIETNQEQEDNKSTPATNRDEMIHVEARNATSISSQSTTTALEESTAKRTRIATETTSTDAKPKIIAVDDASMWVKVHDPKTNKYYYWNKVRY